LPEGQIGTGRFPVREKENTPVALLAAHAPVVRTAAPQ